MGQRLTAWGGAYLTGFVLIGLIQHNFGLRVGAGLDFGALVLFVGAAGMALGMSCRRHPRLSPRLVLALWAALGGWWAARHGGRTRVYKAVAEEATVVRRQLFSAGFNPWPYLLVATARGQFVVRGRYRAGERGWLSCPVAGLRGEPCRFETAARPRGFRPHPIKRLADRGVRRLSASIAMVRPKSAARFYSAVLLARPRQLSAATKESFKRLGIYHLLVTSGLHFAILLGFIQLLFDGLMKAAYGATLISPYRWFFCRRLSVIASFGVLFGYGLGLGLPAPLVRGLFMVGISQLAALSWWQLALTPRLMLSLIAATAIFPLGFFTSGSLLSWGCTLLLCLWAAPEMSQQQKGALAPVARFMLWQGQLVLLSLLLLGSYTPLAWLANGLIAAAFAPLLIVAFTAVAGHALLGLTGTLGFIGSLAEQFQALVATIDSWLPIGLIMVPMRTPLAQLVAELIAVAVCGLTWRYRALASEQEV